MTARSRPAPPPNNDYLKLGVIAGGLSLVAAGIASFAAGARRPLVVGGVDLSRVDLRRPFYVDMSTGPRSTLEQRQQGLQRTRAALEAFYQRWPAWLVSVDVDVDAGRFLMSVVPTTPAPSSSAFPIGGGIPFVNS